jgi:copper chaperone CopZ
MLTLKSLTCGRAMRAGAMVVAGSWMGVAGGCASAQSDRAKMQENAVVHTATPAELATTKGSEPVDGSSVMLWVNGLGCPQCASNIDFQLKRVRGVSDVYTDLGTGKVTVSLAGGRNPTPDRLNDAVQDAGMTLVKLEAVK